MQLTNNGIGLKNEKSLHAALKEWYFEKGDMIEVLVDKFVIDIVRDNLLIEIQTGNFSAIRRKLNMLLVKHKIRLIYPIPKQKWIIKVDPDTESVVSIRKSSRHGRVCDLFNQLIYIPDLINCENFEIEVLMIEEEDVRCEDGKGSWRRKGVSKKDRVLKMVLERINFKTGDDFLRLLPNDLQTTFSNKILSEVMKISKQKAGKITYCLKKMGLIEEVGRNKNGIIYSKRVKCIYENIYEKMD